LFRIARPATPDKHLCVYFALFDEARRTVLLVDHVKAACGSSPAATSMTARSRASRCGGRRAKSCGSRACSIRRFGDDPLFLTVTRTRGEHSHTDVSFWFVLHGDRDMGLDRVRSRSIAVGH
jgi:hypothetical protein